MNLCQPVCLYSVLRSVTSNSHCKMFVCHSGCGPNCEPSYDKFPFSELIHSGSGAVYCQQLHNDVICFCNPGYIGSECRKSKYSLSCFVCNLVRFYHITKTFHLCWLLQGHWLHLGTHSSLCYCLYRLAIFLMDTEILFDKIHTCQWRRINKRLPFRLSI